MATEPIVVVLTAGVGMRVIVVGMAVMMPGFCGTCSAQMPVK